jgi:uncharacterized protein
MKLHQSVAQDSNLITAYESDRIRINQQFFSGNLVITPSSVSVWDAPDFAGLTPAHFAALLALEPEVVLFGSGAHLRFPHPSLTAALTNSRIGVEVMDTQAACRCFNILMEENRRVVAVVLNQA